jgi:hypothetical protein
MSDTYVIIDTDSYSDEDKSWHVKIGRSRNPRTRMSGFKTGNPGTLALAATIPGGEWEPLLHKMYAGFRRNGEWFRLDTGRIYLLATIADESAGGWTDYGLLDAMPNPSMQAADHTCLIESEAFMEGWGVGEAYEKSRKLRVAG